MSKPIFISKTCQCGCNEAFEARLNYRHRAPDGKPSYPDYKRGHHPNCRETQTSNKTPWNSGLRKGDHASMANMGFREGHKPFNDWSKVNEKLRTDPALRQRWLAAKKGQIPWNAGLTKEQYPNGIVTGEQHGNWLGGNGGVRDTAAFAAFRRSILKRDHWTCQACGDRNHKGRGSRIVLHVDHIEPVCVAPERALDPSNARTLCFDCHVRTETYGPKVRHYIKKRLQAKAAP